MASAMANPQPTTHEFLSHAFTTGGYLLFYPVVYFGCCLISCLPLIPIRVSVGIGLVAHLFAVPAARDYFRTATPADALWLVTFFALCLVMYISMIVVHCLTVRSSQQPPTGAAVSHL